MKKAVRGCDTQRRLTSDTRLLLAIEPCPLLFRVFGFVAWRLHFDQEDPRRALLTSRILPPHLLGRLVFL
jgi:hypothetical protein